MSDNDDQESAEQDAVPEESAPAEEAAKPKRAFSKTPLFVANNAARYQRQTIIRDIENKTERTLLCYVGGNEAEITRDDTVGFVDLLHNVPRDAKIDLVLHTPGGLALAATQIARALARQRGKVTVFVPHYAMSGGTLIALAADEIVMSEHAVLGPADPQVGGAPAASILRAVERKPIAEVDDETLILADQSEMALNQLRQTIHDLTADRLPEHVRDTLASDLSEGRWTHDYPVTVDEARRLGLTVSTDVPPEILELMALYPQPVRKQPSVEYSPGRRSSHPRSR